MVTSTALPKIEQSRGNTDISSLQKVITQHAENIGEQFERVQTLLTQNKENMDLKPVSKVIEEHVQKAMRDYTEETAVQLDRLLKKVEQSKLSSDVASLQRLVQAQSEDICDSFDRVLKKLEQSNEGLDMSTLCKSMDSAFLDHKADVGRHFERMFKKVDQHRLDSQVDLIIQKALQAHSTEMMSAVRGVQNSIREVRADIDVSSLHRAIKDCKAQTDLSPVLKAIHDHGSDMELSIQRSMRDCRGVDLSAVQRCIQEALLDNVSVVECRLPDRTF